MTETFKERLNRLITEAGMNTSSASKAAGVDRATLRKLLDGTNLNPSAKTLDGLSSLFGVSRDWLLTGDDGQALEEKRINRSSEQASLLNEVPIKGTVAASYVSGRPGADTDIIGGVPMPPPLAHIRGAYALYVEGRSMEPQYFPGDLIFLNPARPPRIGDCVVIITKDGPGIQRTLGIFEAENAQHVTLHKHSRENGNGLKIHIPKADIKARHKVLTINEIFGA